MVGLESICRVIEVSLYSEYMLVDTLDRKVHRACVHTGCMYVLHVCMNCGRVNVYMFSFIPYEHTVFEVDWPLSAVHQL